MVSRMPVLSGKQFGSRVAPDKVLPIFLFVVLFIALLIAYPWPVLTLGTLAYLVSLPFGVRSYRQHERRSAKPERAASSPAEPHAETSAPPPPDVSQAEPPDPDRPARLN
jgi:CDP-diacylglycerol--serine O-phosphatidyltransferase